MKIEFILIDLTFFKKNVELINNKKMKLEKTAFHFYQIK